MIEFENFRLEADKEPLLSLPNTRFDTGKKILVWGNNGIGKTLLLKTLHGDYNQYAGTIHFTTPSSILKPKKKKQRQSIYMELIPSLLDNESVWKNLTLPFPKLTPYQKHKLQEMCQNVGIHDKISQKIYKLPFSAKKFVELIRTTVQAPQLICIDDFDCYFDEIHYMQAVEILRFATNSGSTVLATSKSKLNGFDEVYRIHNKEMELL
jgi:ABC-type transport system involved in cytochrome c biogenesis ATPase subunit